MMTNEQIEKILENEQQEVTPTLWGNEYPSFKPYLVEKIYGDGMCLIYFGTLEDRPYWWLVRVDSSYLTDNEEYIESFIDEYGNSFTEVIHTQIEDECGCIDEYDEEYDEENLPPYPAITRWTSEHYGLVADLKNGVDRYGFSIIEGGEK